MLRDQAGRYEDAARWFRAARRSAAITTAQEVLISHELIELEGFSACKSEYCQ